MKINTKFANNPVYNEVKKNENYGKFIDKDGTPRQHKVVKLNFLEKVTSHKEGSRNVVCKICCRVEFNIPFYWENALTDHAMFDVVGVAVCAESDKFNLGKGTLIAQAKAENEAYKAANNMLAELKRQLDNFSMALDQPIANIDEYKLHNDKFIENVIEDRVKPKY